MHRFALLLGCLFVAPLVAQDTLDRAELPLAHGSLSWSAGGGLAVSLGRQKVCLAAGAEFVLHDVAWTKQLFTSRQPTSARLLKQADRTVLTVVYAEPRCRAEQTITAGPGDHFEVAWRWQQTGWDAAAVQLAWAKPAEGFWAGASYEATAGGKPVKGTIPVVFSEQNRHPFSSATQLTVRSLFGTVRFEASKPVSLFDYPERHGAFWLGCDVPVPRGREDSCVFKADLAAPDLVVSGVRLTGLTASATVADGQASVAMRLGWVMPIIPFEA